MREVVVSNHGDKFTIGANIELHPDFLIVNPIHPMDSSVVEYTHVRLNIRKQYASLFLGSVYRANRPGFMIDITSMSPIIRSLRIESGSIIPSSVVPGDFNYYAALVCDLIYNLNSFNSALHNIVSIHFTDVYIRAHLRRAEHIAPYSVIIAGENFLLTTDKDIDPSSSMTSYLIRIENLRKQEYERLQYHSFLDILTLTNCLFYDKVDPDNEHYSFLLSLHDIPEGISAAIATLSGDKNPVTAVWHDRESGNKWSLLNSILHAPGMDCYPMHNLSVSVSRSFVPSFVRAGERYIVIFEELHPGINISWSRCLSRYIYLYKLAAKRQLISLSEAILYAQGTGGG